MNKKDMHTLDPITCKCVPNCRRCKLIKMRSLPMPSETMTKRERKQLVILLASFIRQDFQNARIASCAQYDLTVIRLDRIESFAYAAMVNFVEAL